MKNTTLLISFLALCFLNFQSFGQTSVPYLISTNQTWDMAGSPYQLGSVVTLGLGVSVTIMPGVHVESVGHTELLVNGELQVLGNVDSFVEFNNVTVHLNPSAEPYNPITLSGAFFNFTKFTNTYYQQYVFKNRAKGCCIKNSLFMLGGNGFQSSPLVEDSSFFEMTNCNFTDIGPNENSHVLVHGSLTEHIVTDCVFEKIRSVSFWRGHGSIKNNVFDSLTTASFDTDENYEIQCNKFLNLLSGVHIYPKGGVISFMHNTLDSCGSLLQSNPFGLLNIATDSTLINGVGTLDISNNNFLTQLGQTEKVEFRHYSSVTGGDSFNVNLTNNYWATYDSSAIADMIIDATDDGALASIADYSNFLSSMDTDCPSQSTAAARKFKNATVSVFPNPVSNTLFISKGANPVVRASIFGINGSEILEIDERSLESIDVNELNSGLYFLVLIDNQGQELRTKFIKR